MPNQIFINIIPINILINFLNSICKIENGFFIFTNESYKRSLLHNNLSKFINDISPYYHKSKKHYIQRKMNFTHLATLVRQICRSHSIAYTSKLVYSLSTYHIRYIISIPDSTNLSGSEK